MKTTMGILVLVCGMTLTNGYAQPLREKINERLSGNKGSTELVSQGVTAATWSDGEYTWYTMRSGVWFFDEETEKKQLTFTKNSKGEVTEVKMGNYTYKGDADGKSEFIRYYTASGSGWHLYFTNKCVIIFEGEEGSSIRGSLKSKCKQGEAEKLKTFLKEGRAAQEEDIKKYNAKVAEENRLAALEKEKKFSIKDKDVAKLEIINIKVPEKFGHFTSFSFDIKATLKDGNVLSTDNGGFLSDYTISYEGGSYTEGKIQGVFINDDKIKINVVSKFNPAIKAVAEVVPLYNQDISFNYNGVSWSRAAGEPANNFKLEVKQAKHKVKGHDVLAIRITNLSQGTVVSEFKMAADKVLHFTCKGGNGGSDNGRGNDGASGGNITVIKDPSVKTFNLDYTNNGGKGGRGNTTQYDGRPGRDGIYKEETKAVTF